MINRLCIIGVGLIGGSLARALRSAGMVESVIGCGRGEANLIRAKELGVIDEYSFDPAAAVDGADMVVVATSLGATRDIFSAIASSLDTNSVVTDVGSAKRRVVDAARECLGSNFARFVPGHPIAGTEHSGVEASFETLFDGHRVILTPVNDTDVNALAKVREMWSHTGAKIVELDVERHDDVLAATSHLPHMLAYALVDSLARMDNADNVFAYAAGGFRDFSRIASSNPGMWSDIAIDNQRALLEVMDDFAANFARLRDALAANDRETLLRVFERAKNTRDNVVLPEKK